MPDEEPGTVQPGAARLMALEAAFQEAQRFIEQMQRDRAGSGAASGAALDPAAPADDRLAGLAARIEALEALVERQAGELAALKTEVAALRADQQRQRGLWLWRR